MSESKNAYLREKNDWTDQYTYVPGMKKNPDIIDDLPPGVYDLVVRESMMSSRTLVFEEAKLNSDLIKITSDPFLSLARDITGFFKDNTKKVYADLKMKHFLGVLLFGPAGTGKTCFVEVLNKTLIDSFKASVIRIPGNINLGELYQITQVARRSENKLIVINIDEVDQFSYNGNFLSFLDGHLTPNNMLLMACTNKPHKLSLQLTDRPSRFAIKKEIKYIPEVVIKQLVSSILPDNYLKRFNLNEFCEKLSKKEVRIDQIKNMVLNFFKDKRGIDDAIQNVLQDNGINAYKEEDEDF